MELSMELLWNFQWKGTTKACWQARLRYVFDAKVAVIAVTLGFGRKDCSELFQRKSCWCPVCDERPKSLIERRKRNLKILSPVLRRE